MSPFWRRPLKSRCFFRRCAATAPLSLVASLRGVTGALPPAAEATWKLGVLCVCVCVSVRVCVCVCVHPRVTINSVDLLSVLPRTQSGG